MSSVTKGGPVMSKLVKPLLFGMLIRNLLYTIIVYQTTTLSLQGNMYNTSIYVIYPSLQGNMYNTSIYVICPSLQGNMYNTSIYVICPSLQGNMYNSSIYVIYSSLQGNMYNTSIYVIDPYKCDYRLD